MPASYIGWTQVAHKTHRERPKEVNVTKCAAGASAWMADPHSKRKAVIGSTRTARCAGTHTAKRATAVSNRGVTINASGSHAFTSNRNDARNRVSPNAPAI